MIEVTDVKYDLDGSRGYEEYYQHAEGDGLTREEMLKKLPTRYVMVHPRCDDICEMESECENKDDFIESVNYYFQKRIEENGWLCIGFSYKYRSDLYGLIEGTFEEPPLKEQMKKWEKLGYPIPGV